MHQSLCNPLITSLIKAINAGFLRGAPHLNAKSIQKYLMPSPATSKGHMKWPCKGLQSTTPKPNRPSLPRPPYAPSICHPVMPGLTPDDNNNNNNNNKPQPAFIDDIDDESIANVFCFGTFADKNTSVIYNNCTGNFPFMSLDGNICFFSDVPLQNKHHIRHAHPWSRFAKYPRRTPQKSTSWTIRQQKQSNCTLPHSNVASSLLNSAITMPKPLNGLSKH
jgi:hypothetical protein